MHPAARPPGKTAFARPIARTQGASAGPGDCPVGLRPSATRRDGHPEPTGRAHVLSAAEGADAHAWGTGPAAQPETAPFPARTGPPAGDLRRPDRLGPGAGAFRGSGAGRPGADGVRTAAQRPVVRPVP